MKYFFRRKSIVSWLKLSSYTFCDFTCSISKDFNEYIWKKYFLFRITLHKIIVYIIIFWSSYLDIIIRRTKLILLMFKISFLEILVAWDLDGSIIITVLLPRLKRVKLEFINKYKPRPFQTDKWLGMKDHEQHFPFHQLSRVRNVASKRTSKER